MHLESLSIRTTPLRSAVRTLPALGVVAALVATSVSAQSSLPPSSDREPNYESITVTEHFPGSPDGPPETLTCDWYPADDVTVDLVRQYRYVATGNHGSVFCGPLNGQS